VNLQEIIGIGIALGIDCLAVSAAIATAGPTKSTVVLSCLMFGLFQSGMALAGMAGGSGLARLVSSPLRFAPPVILCAIGLVMILKKPGRMGEPPGVAGVVAVVGAAVSVSLDALGAGVAMGIAGIVSLLSAAVIGFISVGMSILGFAAGGVLGRRAAWAEKVGGLILIGLAIIIFVTGL
jgi:putative Mn2+ efflux pump MntP